MGATKKRFTNTALWDDDWFLELPNKYKLAWFYIKDECDHAGIWKPNIRKLEFAVNAKYNVKDLLKHLNDGKDRIHVLNSGNWLICGFYYFQYGRCMNFGNKVHASIANIYVDEDVNINMVGIRNITGATEEFIRLIKRYKPVNVSLTPN